MGTLATLPRSLRGVGGARALKILVHYRYTNPYGMLLYRAIREGRPDIAIAFTDGGRQRRRIAILIFPATALLRRLTGYRIAHIHWPDFGLGNRFPFHQRAALVWFHVCWWMLRTLRYRIVWTVHNVVPHEQQTSNDLRIARVVAATADVKIAHSKQTIEELEQLRLDAQRVVVIPHGSYQDLYGDAVPGSDARARLGLGEDEFVILFFGLVRRYKGVNELLRTFTELAIPSARLVVAGSCPDPTLREEIERLADNRVVLALNYIEDEYLSTYFSAADVVCLPFRSMTTSGSLMLALTFGKPVIAPDVGNASDLPRDVGWLYDVADTQGLRRSLEAAARDRSQLKDRAVAAARCSTLVSWSEIACKTLAVYDEVSRGLRRGQLDFARVASACEDGPTVMNAVGKAGGTREP